MATIFWTAAASGNWTDAPNWTPATAPGIGDDAVLGVTGIAIVEFYTVSVEVSIDVNSIAITDGGAVLSVDGAGSVSVTAQVLNDGEIDVKNGGTLTAASLQNNGALDILGTAGNQSTVDIASAAPATLGGTVTLTGNALLRYGSGSIQSIASGAKLILDGDTVTSGAFSGLTSVAGPVFGNAPALQLHNGAALTLGGSLTNSGEIDIDTNTFDGGSTLTIVGTLTNTGALLVGTGNVGFTGSGHLTAPTTVNVGGLGNTGTIYIGGNNTGAAGGATQQATLDVLAAAPSALTGGTFLVGDALLEYASGSIQSISSGAQLSIDGAQARVADAGASTTNSALTGLTSVAGTVFGNAAAFQLHNGATVSLSGSLANSGEIDVDTNTFDGGSTLTIAGTLTNTGALLIGTGNVGFTGSNHLSAPTTVNVGGLGNTGTIYIGGNNTGATGGATEQATLDVLAAAPSALTGHYALVGDALLEFASGSIQSISGGAQLSIDGAQARVADAGATTTNSALTGLTSTSGAVLNSTPALALHNGATVSLSGSLANSGEIDVDTNTFDGGSTFTIAGTLTNTGYFLVGTGNPDFTGSNHLSASTNVTVGGIANTGTVWIGGNNTGTVASATQQATLNVLAAAPSTLTGNYALVGDALLEFASGSIQSIANGAQLYLNGAQARVADAGATSTSSALNGLTSIAGSVFANAPALMLVNGASLALSGALNNSGEIRLDDGTRLGGSTLTIAGTLTNSGALEIGADLLSAATTVTVGGLVSSGQIDVVGNHVGDNNQATLNVLAAAPATLTSRLNLNGDALVEYASGGIQSIASGGELTIIGPQARVADAGATTTNSALTGLNSIAGSVFANAPALSLINGAVLALNGALNNSGEILIDDGTRLGGSALTVAGTLTNSGALEIGADLLSAATNVTVGDLVSTGQIDVVGNHVGDNNQATLDVLAAAPTTLTSKLNLNGDALVEYASGGIQSIASGAELTIIGPQARVADAGATTTNSALTGLNSIAGSVFANAPALSLINGAVLALNGALNNSGEILIDDGTRLGGSTLTIAGTLTNSGALEIGADLLSAATNVTVGGLVSSGQIDVVGNAVGDNNQATLDVLAAAPATLTSRLNLNGDALVEYASGSIQSIASGGELSINGPQARVADAGATTTSSALTGLNSIAGPVFANAPALTLTNGAVLALNGALNNSGEIRIDTGTRQGGSTLTIAGTLTNSGLLQVGANLLSSATNVTVGGLANTGEIDLTGSTTSPTSLNVLGSASNSSTLSINADAQMGVTGAFSDTGTINLGGTLDIANPLTISGGGSLVMQGGTIVDPNNGAITIGVGSILSGNGVIEVPVTNNGTINVSGGLLDITGDVTGSGQINVANGSELEVGGSVSGGSFSFNGNVGTLKIDHPSTFTDSISGLVVGDTIDLAGVQATNAVLNGTTLTVTAGSQTYNYQVAGPGLNGTNVFALQNDQHGGTNVVLGTPGPVIFAPNSQTAFLDWPSVLGPLTIGDPNAGNGLLTVTITSSSGLLAGADINGNPLGGNGTDQLVLTGSLADINTMLASVIYLGVSAGASDNVHVLVTDANNAVASQTISVTTDTVPFTQMLFNGPAGAVLFAGVPTDIGGLNLSDPYAEATGQQVTLGITSAGGLQGPLTASGGPGGTVTGQGTNGVSISGTVDQINSYLSDGVAEALEVIAYQEAVAQAKSLAENGTAQFIFGEVDAGEAYKSYEESLKALTQLVIGLQGLAEVNSYFEGLAAGAELAALFAESFGKLIVTVDSQNLAFTTDVLSLVVEGVTGENGDDGGEGGGEGVHLVTFSGVSYQLDAAGEFLLAGSKISGNSFAVQARLQPLANSASASAITQIAAEVGNDRVTFGVGRTSTVWVDGVATSINPATGLTLAGGKVTQTGPSTYLITWNTGETLVVADYGSYLDVKVRLTAGDGPGSVQGLLGPHNGQANDFTLPNGTVLQQPLTTNALYSTFANAWRISQADSLFDYDGGQTTATFTNTNFPTASITLADLPADVVAQAAQAVSAAGITDAGAFAATELDYIASGGDPNIIATDKSLFQGASLIPASVTESQPAPAVLGVIAPVPAVQQAQSGPTHVTFDVYLTSTVLTDTEVDYSVVAPDAGDFDASAFGGTLPSGSITIAAGLKTGTITIDVPQGALGALASENVALKISTPDNVPVFAPTAVETVSSAAVTAPTSGKAAAAQLEYLGSIGTFTHVGNNYTLNLGDVVLGQELPALQFGIANEAIGSGDGLAGSFTWTNVAGFNVSVDGNTTSGASLLSAIAAGFSGQDLTVTTVQNKYGPQSETITFNPIDTNPSGYSSPLDPITLTIADTLEIPGTIYSQAWGDVHIITYNGLEYDFQAAGEFTLAKSLLPNDSFDIQLRLQPYSSSGSVTYITQVAASVGTDDLTFTGGVNIGATVLVNGQVSTLSMANPTLNLAGGTVKEISPTLFEVDWNTGETMTVTDRGTFFNVSDSVPYAAVGSVMGLQGENESTANDFQLPDGTILPQPLTSCDLYGTYASAWQVTADTSLFYYAPGQSVATFANTGFSTNIVTLADIPTAVLAQVAARVAAAGITDPATVANAELDFLATGDPSVLNSGANINQQVSGLTAASVTPCNTPVTAIGVIANATSVTELASGVTAVTFTAYLTGTAAADTTVNYSVVTPGSAFLGASAFGGTLPTGQVTIVAGQQTAQFTINVPQGALGTTPDANLQVQVSSPGNVVQIFGPTAQTEIVNDTAEAGNLAQPVLAYLGNVGTFSFNSATHTYTLDLGGIVQGSALVAAEFAVANAAVGPADNLSGTFGFPSGTGFTVTGNNLPSILAPGDTYEGLYTSINTADLGTNVMTLTFTPTDVNDSGYSSALAPITLEITDTVTAAAAPQVNTPTTIIFPNARVGSVDSQHVSITNTATSGAAGLDVTLTASGNATAAGSITQLAPGTTDASDLTVGIDTSAAGARAGSVIEHFLSDTGGTTSPVSIEDPYIDVFGGVYNEAAASITPVNTIVHVGDPGSLALTVANTAESTDGYSEALIASLAGTIGGFWSASNTPSADIAAGANNTTALQLGFSTQQAAVLSGTATVALISDGGTGANSIDGLGQIAIAPQVVPVSITVDNYAKAALQEISGGGTFTHSGNTYTLDLGVILQGTTPVTIDLGVLNAATGPADLLSGTFNTSGPGAYTLTGFSAFSGLGAAGSQAAGTVTIDTSTTGLFTETITLSSTGSNASGYSAALSNVVLTITGHVETPGVSIDPIDNGVIDARATAVGVPITGTVSGLSAGALFTVTVTDGAFSHNYTATVNSDASTWLATIPAADVSHMPDGTATVTAQVLTAQAQRTVGVEIVPTASTVTLTVQTPNGINLSWPSLYEELANSPIDAGGTDTAFTATDTGGLDGHSAPIKFVIAGNALTYSGTSPNIQLTGGLVTGIELLDASNHLLASYSNFLISAVGLQAALNSYDSTYLGSGTASPTALNNIFLADQYEETGNAGVDILQGGNLADLFHASAGNDLINGGAGIDVGDYSPLQTPGIIANIANGNGTVQKGNGLGTDKLTSVQVLTGTSGDDIFYVDAGETVAGAAGFNYLIELTPGVNLAYGVNFTGISEFVSNVGNNTVTFAADPNIAYVYGSIGNDTFTLGAGGGYLFGGGGANILNGAANTVNFLIDSGGTNTMNGGGGGAENFFDVLGSNDQVNGAGAFNVMSELAPNATVQVGGSQYQDIQEIIFNGGTNQLTVAANDSDFLYVYGGAGTDTLTLGSGGGYLLGGGGTNTLTGGGNSASTDIFIADVASAVDTMNGGAGINIYYVNNNSIVLGAGTFNLVSGLTNVSVQLGSAHYQHVQQIVLNGGSNTVTVAAGDSDLVFLNGGAGNDNLTTGTGGGYLLGGGGTNTLTGGGGTNVFVADGGSGVDTMNGGSGSNVYYIDAHSIVHGAGTFNTVLELQQNASLTYGSAQLGTNVQEVVLNGGTNTADFSTDSNTIYLYGASGNDTLFGGTGNDFFFGAAGTNTFAFKTGWGHDTIMDWTAGTNNQIDLTALAAQGVHGISDLTQTIVSGSDVITSSHTGTNAITLNGFNGTLTGSSFHFA